MGRVVQQILKSVAAMVLTAICLSVAWVFAYGKIDPRATAHMGLRGQAGQTIQQQWVSLEEVSPHVIRAVISAEDTKFCSHHGFDFEQIQIALQEADAGKTLRGASTISQQTAKNAFLWHGRSFARKAAEAWFTFLMETMWSKERVLEVYINIAEWGDGNFGIEAAAQARFGKSAADLTAREAALLAAVLPDPQDWRVDPPGPYVTSRSNTLLRRMATVREQGLDHCATPQAKSSSQITP